MLQNKKVLITGGTGTVGTALLKTLIQKYPGIQVTVFSRDELKQQELRNLLATNNQAKISFIPGDVRDLPRLMEVFAGIDVVIHAAALKQVSVAELHPLESIKTNLIGTQNVITAAIANKVETLLHLSTDKAVLPISAYGASKLAAEKLMTAASTQSIGSTRFLTVRLGNIIGSRGSVLPLFEKLASQNLPLPVTHPNMTRFCILPQQTIKAILLTLEKGKTGEIWLPVMPSFKVIDLAYAVTNPQHPLTYIGVRPGEKITEHLYSEEESNHTVSLNGHYVILPFDVDVQTYTKHNGAQIVTALTALTSTNATLQLGVEELRAFIKDTNN